MIQLNMPRIPPQWSCSMLLTLILTRYQADSDLNTAKPKAVAIGPSLYVYDFFLLSIGNGEATKIEDTDYYLLVYTHSVILVIRQSNWFAISDYSTLFTS